ncbi:MAG: hypothetical protein WDO24_26490 [Pseudomonadota bacterium]
MIAHLLVTEGFTTVEEIAYVATDELGERRRDRAQEPRARLHHRARCPLRGAAHQARRRGRGRRAAAHDAGLPGGARREGGEDARRRR